MKKITLLAILALTLTLHAVDCEKLLNQTYYYKALSIDKKELEIDKVLYKDISEDAFIAYNENNCSLRKDTVLWDKEVLLDTFPLAEEIMDHIISNEEL